MGGASHISMIFGIYAGGGEEIKYDHMFIMKIILLQLQGVMWIVLKSFMHSSLIRFTIIEL